MVKPAHLPTLAVDPDIDYTELLADYLERMDTTAFQDRVGPHLNGHSMTALESLLAKRSATGWRADPWTMARHLEGDRISDWPYTRLLANRFRAAVTGESRFQAWSLPAQVGKSTWLRRGCVWALDLDPSLNIIYLAYGDLLARESAMFVRDTAVANQDQLRFQLRPDLRTQKRWQTTEGGGMLATGIGGSVSGFPAGGVIVDDPMKNWREAHSRTKRDDTWNEIVAVARLRLREGGWFILAHTRWHLDDPTGRMHQLADELGVEVEFVTLPMLAEDNDPLGRQPGEPLEPERYSLAEAQSRAKFLGSYLTASLEQQNPQPEEGGEVKREWWRWSASPPPAFADCVTSWDMKLKDKESGDYVVGLVGGRAGGAFWVTDMIRGQFSQLQTKCAIALMHVRHPAARAHIVENSGNGPEVMTELRRGDPTFMLADATADKLGMTGSERTQVERIIRNGMAGIVGNNARGSKLVRARAVAAYIENGSVTLAEGKAWANALVDEWAAFPPRSGGHDDIVDATSQLLARLANSQAAVLEAPTRTIDKPSPSARATPGATRGRILG